MECVERTLKAGNGYRRRILDCRTAQQTDEMERKTTLHLIRSVLQHTDLFRKGFYACQEVVYGGSSAEFSNTCKLYSGAATVYDDEVSGDWAAG